MASLKLYVESSPVQKSGMQISDNSTSFSPRPGVDRAHTTAVQDSKLTKNKLLLYFGGHVSLASTHLDTAQTLTT